MFEQIFCLKCRGCLGVVTTGTLVLLSAVQHTWVFTRTVRRCCDSLMLE
jgi:hypothetical protein